jgi:vacuolar-type H+-ATPase subunit D/Vma8
MKAAIEEKEWERVNLLASKREDLVQKTNAFVSQNQDIEEELKNNIIELLKEINQVDEENSQKIHEDKAQLQKIRSQLTLGQKALNAYQKGKNIHSGHIDKSM